MTLTAALLIAVAGPTRAQVEPANEVREPLGYNGLGAGLAAGELVTASFRWTRVGSSGFGFDGAVTTVPATLAQGALLLALQGGPALSVPLRRSALLVKAGAGPVIFLGDGVGGVLVAYYGVGLVIIGDPVMGLRVDWTRHHVIGNWSQGVGTLEFGFVKSVR